MAQFDLDRIFNNAENQSQKKKKKYDIDRILNSAEDISTRNTTMGTIPAITGSAIQATNKIITPMAKTTTNLTEADLRKIEQNSGLKTGTLNLNKMQAQQQKFENLQQKGNEILQDKNNKIYDVDYIYSDLGIDNGKVFKKSSAFKDGYDFGDITKTVLDTSATLGTEVVKGVANIGENIGDLASYGIAGVADLLGEDEYADKVRKNAQVSLVDKYTKPLSSKIDKNSILGSKGKEMAQSLGYVAGTAAIGTATGGTAGILGKTAEGAAKAANIATTATTFASSMGSGVTEAYQNGATDQEALAYGIISGIGEAGSELMFGGLGKVFGKVGFNPTGGALDEVVVQGLSRNIKNKMVKTLVQSGLMATGEGIEEVVSGVVSAIGKKATFMKEEDLKNILKDENLAEQFWMGTLTSVIAQAPSTISSIKNKTDYLTGEKWETTQKNKTPELPQNVQNNIEQQTIQTDTKTTQNQNMSQISDTNENNLKNTAINEINNSKISEQAKKDMLNAINSMENVDEESYNNIKQTLNEINKNELQTNSTYQDNLERRKNYVKYKDDINTYDNSAVEEVLSIIPTNRNGKRTVNQWLQVADEIGKRISGKSNAEIQEIAYKSWFENQPTKNITQYDSARKTSIGFQKLNSDMWVNKINEAVLKERTRLENTTNSQQVNLNNTQTNQESPIEDILNNKVDNNLETLYNNTKIGETTIIPVKTILSIQNSEGGYRTETQINNLKKDIEKNGITTPIEIYRKNNGTFAIENGNHRLKIAQELGIKDIPVKMVESWENIGVSTKNATKDFTQEYGGVYDDRITEKNSNIDEGRWNRERSRSGNNNQFGDSGRARRNAELYETKSYSNEQTSINESKRNNSKQLKNPEKGSFSIETRTNLEDIKINNNIAPIGKNVKRGPLIEEIAPKATTQVKNSFDKNEDFKVPKVLKDIPKDKSPLKVLKDEFIQATVNKGHYVDQLAKQKNNPELTYKYDRNLGAFAEGQFTIGRGQTDNNGKIIGKSVKEIWKPAEKANLVNEFSEYLLYKHNVDRINQNNPLLGYEINAPQSAEIAKKLETKYPQFKEWAKDVYTYYDNELQNFVDAGLITEEFKNQLNEMYPHYVKISRNIENNFNVKSDEKVAGGKNPIKRATGGNSDILPLKETMASYAIQAKKAIRQNELGKEVANTLKLKDVIKKNNKLLYEEIARTNDSNAAADMFFNSINNSLVDNSDGQTKLIYYDDGDIVNVKIDDKLYKSLDTKDVFKDFENSNILTKAVSKSLQKVSKIQRDLLTTYNLGFAMVNPIKDIQDGAFNSKYPGKFAQNYAKAIGEMTKGKKSELYMLYLANGGNSNTYYEYDTKMPTKNYKFGDGINKANEVVETLPRFAEFISTIENGGSINEAMYNAAEITTNFKRGGNFTKFLNRNGANFLNASVQGLSKQIRNITGQNGWKGYAQLITKSVLLGVAPALLNDVLLGDDDEYEELPDYIKDEYYLFKKSDGNFVRIPKGRVLSVIGMTARRTVEATKGNEEAFDNWWSEVVSQMAPNNPLEDNITAPIKAVKDNKTWYGTNIVSSRLQKELPKNQYDETTDEFSKWLGEKINVSPKKINYLIDQYSGGIGDIVLPKITPQAKDNIIQDKFTANSTLKNKNPGKFYELLEETTQLANDVEPVESDVLKAKYLNSVNSDMSKLYKEKRTIQMSDMTQEAKKEAVEEIQSKINSLAEQAINESNNVTTNSNYATVRR